VSFDDEVPQILTVVLKGYFVDNGNRDWEESVKDGVRKVTSRHAVSQPGYHTFKAWMVDPGVVLQKIVVNTGGVRPSYLGPPESYHLGTPGP
jgi:Gylcosyl hydrolase family 115 C-terminal domain